jgi:hypothetical protein
VKVLYEEGLTSHLGPESCVGSGNGTGEALTGGTASRAIEPRKAFRDQSASVVVLSEGQDRAVREMVRAYRTLRGRRTRARVQASYTGTERSCSWPRGDGRSVRGENPMGVKRR